MPMRRAVLMMRQAISPRLAMRSLENMHRPVRVAPGLVLGNCRFGVHWRVEAARLGPWPKREHPVLSGRLRHADDGGAGVCRFAGGAAVDEGEQSPLRFGNLSVAMNAARQPVGAR